MPDVRAVLLSFVLAAPSASAASSPGELAITGVTIVDPGTESPRPGMTVLIRDGKIAAIHEAGRVPLPSSARTVDGRGKYLIPGLWDMHVHLSWTRPSALPVLVANGVTGVRDMGGRLSEIDEWKAQISAGLLVGPRIVRAGPILNGKSFNPLQMVPGTPEATRGTVRALKHVGVDFLKIHRRLPREAYLALMDEAKLQGLAVAGHIPMTVTPEEASDAGQVSLEHTETLFEGTFSAKLPEGELLPAIRRFRAEAAGTLFARFAKNGTAVTPTLVAYRSIIESLDGAAARDPLRRYVARSLTKPPEKAEKPATDEEIQAVKETFAELRAVVGQMNLSGVPLMAGSDIAGPRVPGFTLHDELALLVESGLTSRQALAAATRNPAKLLGRESELGAVETGRFADLVLLDGDPLADIRNTRKIAAVVLGGRVFERRDLEALLREGEAAAGKN